MEKLAKLQATLGGLSPDRAGQLARTVEFERALGKESLPSALILESLRPVLRVAKPTRIPGLCRLISNGLEEFLTDRCDEPRLEGLIPRGSLMPWWRAVGVLAGPEIAALEERLRKQLQDAPGQSLEPLQDEAQEAAVRWCGMILAELGKAKPERGIRALISASIAQDVGVIADVLSIARPLAQAIRGLMRVGTLLEIVQDGRLIDLPPDCVTALKQQYLDFSERHGTKARYFALAVLNRLEQPQQILRLARAMSWKADDTLVSSTEFGAIGNRLIGEIQLMAGTFLKVRAGATGEPPSPKEIRELLVRYLDEAEGIIGEIGVRRDSPWGTAILKTRSEVADAIDRDFLDFCARHALRILPLTKEDESDVSEAPSRQVIDESLEFARLLLQLRQRGERHGFQQAVRETTAGLDEVLEDRIAKLCAAAVKRPEAAAIIAAQGQAAAELCLELFDETRAEAAGRRIRAALRRAVDPESEQDRHRHLE